MHDQCCIGYVYYFAFYGQKHLYLTNKKKIVELGVFVFKTKRNFYQNKWRNNRKSLK